MLKVSFDDVLLVICCRPAHCAALTGIVEILQTLRSERGNLWVASHVTGNYPLHEAGIARHIGTNTGHVLFVWTVTSFSFQHVTVIPSNRIIALYLYIFIHQMLAAENKNITKFS